MLTIQVDGQLEQRLKDAAASVGAEPQAVARRLLDQSLAQSPALSNAGTLALLEKWEFENATSDPAELKRREEEGKALMEGLARNRRHAPAGVWPEIGAVA